MFNNEVLLMSDERRRRLRRQINRYGKAPERNPTSSPQATILAGLNVLGALEEAAQQYVHDVLWYGPGSFAGQGWAAALIWYREKGYYAYKQVMLFGLWVVSVDAGEELRIGTRKLAYSAPFYNAESYQRLIQRDFTSYYGAGEPPQADDVLYRMTWAVERRLALRQEIRDALVQHLRLVQR